MRLTLSPNMMNSESAFTLHRKFFIHGWAFCSNLPGLRISMPYTHISGCMQITHPPYVPLFSRRDVSDGSWQCHTVLARKSRDGPAGRQNVKVEVGGLWSSLGGVGLCQNLKIHYLELFSKYFFPTKLKKSVVAYFLFY